MRGKEGLGEYRRISGSPELSDSHDLLRGGFPKSLNFQ